jgi:hypothetical protein
VKTFSEQVCDEMGERLERAFEADARLVTFAIKRALRLDDKTAPAECFRMLARAVVKEVGDIEYTLVRRRCSQLKAERARQVNS